MTRAISAIVLAAGVLSAVWFLPVRWFHLMIVLAAGVGLVELMGMFLDDVVETAAAVVAGLAVIVAMLLGNHDAHVAVIAMVVTLFALAAIFMWRSEELPGVAGRLGTACFGIVYIGVALAFWGWLRELEGGRGWVLITLVPAFLTDTFAFLAGKVCGRRPFARKVSPNKTWEGFIGAAFGSAIGAGVIWSLLFSGFMPWWHAAAIAVLLWIVAPVGDLIESMLKRSAGVKDSGSLIPGHGGLLDRMDALIFSAPFVYLYATVVVGA